MKGCRHTVEGFGELQFEEDSEGGRGDDITAHTSDRVV